MRLQILFFLLLLIPCFTSCEKKSDQPTDPSDIDLRNIGHAPTSLVLETPEFFDPIPIPSENPMTQEGVDLGRYLFYDTILSENANLHCGTCHRQENAFANNSAFVMGANLEETHRSVPSLVNIVYPQPAYFWDGRANSIEQLLDWHVSDATILGGNWDMIINFLQKSTFYQEKFRKAFPIERSKEISKSLVIKSLAQFLRTLISADSNYDKAVSANSGGFALTELELDGYFLFFREQNFTPHPGCSHCHLSDYFAGDNYYNNGIDSVDGNTNLDMGRGAVTGASIDNGKFKAPTLRNIEFTAPYMHDGRFETLEEVIEHYKNGGYHADNLDENITGFELSDYEKEALVAFLKSLSDEIFIKNPDFSNPF